MSTTLPPLPWALGELNEIDNEELPSEWRQSILDADGHEIGVSYGWTIEQAKASARLMTAAPDLLQALEELYSLVDMHIGNAEWPTLDKKGAADAIEKATGERP